MKDIKVVAFDCDGVLFDSAQANTAYYNRILNQFNMPELTPEQFAYAHMHTGDEVIAFLFNDEEKLNAAQAYRKQMGYMKFIQYMEIEPSLRSLLERLRPRYKTAIATNRADTINWVLAEHALEKDFDFVVCSLDVDRPKPDPELLVKILEHFGIAPRQALYIGDSTLDDIAAKAAGIPLVAYNNPSLSAAFHIKSLKELEDILEV